MTIIKKNLESEQQICERTQGIVHVSCMAKLILVNTMFVMME